MEVSRRSKRSQNHPQNRLFSPKGGIQALIKIVDMQEEMQYLAVVTAVDAMEQYWKTEDIAKYIKKKFDKMYESGWMCIVGRSFGSQVSHYTKHYVYFFVDGLAILLWKCL
nr:dynein light chain [Hymenolepis microstoma]